MIKRIYLLTAVLFMHLPFYGAKPYQLVSPNGKLEVHLQVEDVITYSLVHESDMIIMPSPISMKMEDGTAFGIGSHVKSVRERSVREIIESPFYKKKSVEDTYNELEILFKENFKLILRAYNEGMAYRFVSTGKKSFNVLDEESSFCFGKNYEVYIPYVKSDEKELEGQFFNSFENVYTRTRLTQMNPDKLSFIPLVVDIGGGKKVCIAESDVESYPGMFIVNREQGTSLTSLFAPYPKTTVQGGHNQLQQVVSEREPFIARCQGGKTFPWRIAIVSTDDKQLADNDMVYRLASSSRVKDLSWIKPGKVAWEWWNHWGLYNVDFETGVNNETYMGYIDFASRNGIEYVILDEGWAVNGQADLFQVVPEIDLKKLIEYAATRNVNLILWAGYYAFERDMERACKHYSEMGIKGFKVDFMDRDDQQMVDFHYKAAEIAANYKLLLDFHGTYKPTGMNRTYPNVINFEGVHGQEQTKWNDIQIDQVTYDVTMPFIRMLAGPVDYTQGAMRNSTRSTYRSVNDAPMSMGTRCRQLAEYVVFESPLNMLCDSPTLYEREQECTDFITKIPTVWDNTVALSGEVGKHIAIARQKEEVWYVGALTNWDERTLKLDLSFLGVGDYVAELYKDGVNANKIASDYKKEIISIPANRMFSVKLAQGGGCAMRIFRR